MRPRFSHKQLLYISPGVPQRWLPKSLSLLSAVTRSTLKSEVMKVSDASMCLLLVVCCEVDFGGYLMFLLRTLANFISRYNMQVD